MTTEAEQFDALREAVFTAQETAYQAHQAAPETGRENHVAFAAYLASLQESGYAITRVHDAVVVEIPAIDYNEFHLNYTTDDDGIHISHIAMHCSDSAELGHFPSVHDVLTWADDHKCSRLVSPATAFLKSL